MILLRWLGLLAPLTSAWVPNRAEHRRMGWRPAPIRLRRPLSWPWWLGRHLGLLAEAEAMAARCRL